MMHTGHVSSSPPRKRPRRPFSQRSTTEAPSFHVLTDGSEYTGCGSVLLTIHETATSHRRYAVSGLSELAARLSADQAFPLHSTKVLCCPTVSSAAGLASLLLTLSQAGAKDLTVIGGAGVSDFVEHVATAILGRRRAYPLVQVCQVPKYDSSATSNEWYQVYRDEYLLVHAKSWPPRVDGRSVDMDDASAIALLYTVRQAAATDEGRESCDGSRSFAVIPPGSCGDETAPVLAPFPDDISFRDGPPLEFVLYLTPQRAPTDDTPRLTKQVYVTFPQDDAFDDGLLMRASHQARALSQQLPFTLSFRETRRSLEQSSPTQLTTCATWRLDDHHVVDYDSHKARIRERCQERSVAGETRGTSVESHQEQARNTSGGPLHPIDENEIDLDLLGDEETTKGTAKGNHDPLSLPELSSPQLLVLGTGCASPSPQRGSSGYAVLMPTLDSTGSRTLAMVGLLECGEGSLTNLARHLPSTLDLHEQLVRLCFVWISHAHLDHYGGLPALIRAIVRGRQKYDTNSSPYPPFLLIAPTKVLSFVKASLGDTQGLFIGATHQEMQHTRGAQILEMTLPHPLTKTSTYRPVHFLRSVPVEHCPHAHALLLGLHDAESKTSILVCFSGDTRPSRALVDEYSRVRLSLQPTVSLLLHEATFDDDERGCLEAHQKRHSTVSEALSIASNMTLDACLLTHFSQRYPRGPPGSAETTKMGQPTAFGFAVDGMRLSLTKAALCNLPALSRNLIQALQGPPASSAATGEEVPRL